MSTSHRPQLESRSGAKAAGYTSTSIEHARLIPGHKTIKYRDSVTESTRLESDDKTTGEGEKQKDRKIQSTLEGTYNTDTQEINKSLTRPSKEKHTKYSVNKPEPTKKGWRSSTTFSRNRKDNSKEKKEGYVNNITKSAYHQEFMRKITK